MTPWDDYPATYRQREVAAVLSAIRAGECAAVVGLSGAGKSNLMGFLAHRRDAYALPESHRLVLIDCNRLPARTPVALLTAIRAAVDPAGDSFSEDALAAVEVALRRHVRADAPLTLLLDRFDGVSDGADATATNNLRALRDAHKYALTYVIAARRPPAAGTELAELFFANTVWLGPFGDGDARWNVARFARRRGLAWGDATATALVACSRGYPALLRACCEAHAAGAPLEAPALAAHPAVRARADEIGADAPSDDELRLSGLLDHPLLPATHAPRFDTTQLTAKENLLLRYLQSRAGEVCEKDDIIRAVWPEDRVVGQGIRDDSLAQLVRRLREKIEPAPSAPRHILTVPGRGYRFQRQA